VTVYTDGACLGNPGPGGYAVLIVEEGGTRLFGAGYRLTTNNRMELTAVIAALKNVPVGTSLTIVSDSKYVVSAMQEGWPIRWKSTGWKRADKKPVQNVDLWSILIDLASKFEIKWAWTRGHDGDPHNEAVDAKAVWFANNKATHTDVGYESASRNLFSE